CFLKPRNNARGFRPVPCVCLVGVRKRAVKWVLPRPEFYGNVITPVAGVGVVKATVFSRPIFVTGARAVRNGIISSRLLAYPKESRHNVAFPGVTLSPFRSSSRQQLSRRERD